MSDRAYLKYVSSWKGKVVALFKGVPSPIGFTFVRVANQAGNAKSVFVVVQTKKDGQYWLFSNPVIFGAVMNLFNEVADTEDKVIQITDTSSFNFIPWKPGRIIPVKFSPDMEVDMKGEGFPPWLDEDSPVLKDIDVLREPKYFPPAP
jgi:hypothetical protein